MPKLSKRKRQLREIHNKRRMGRDSGGEEDEYTTHSASSASDACDNPAAFPGASNGAEGRSSKRLAVDAKVREESVEESDDETPTISQLYARRSQMMADQRLSAATGAAPAVSDVWVQCNKCNKWRRLPADTNIKKLPRKWYCSMNDTDPLRQSCTAPEEDYTTPAVPLPAASVKIEHGKDDEPEDPVTAQVSTADMRKFCGLWSRRMRSMDLAESRLTASSRRQDDAPPTDEFEWVRCCNPKCGKWRAISKLVDPDMLFRKQQLWYCSMNATDETVASCSAPQEPLWNCAWNLRKLRPEESSGVFDAASNVYDPNGDAGCSIQEVRATLAMLKRELARSR